MSAAMSVRRNDERRGRITVQTAEQLIRDTQTLLARAGLRMGHSKVCRTVRAFTGRLTCDGQEYIDFLAARLALTVQQRRSVAEQYARVIAYADPTGETAVANVLRAGAK